LEAIRNIRDGDSIADDSRADLRLYPRIEEQTHTERHDEPVDLWGNNIYDNALSCSAEFGASADPQIKRHSAYCG